MAHPLMCWDIVKEGMYRSGLFEKDLSTLNAIMCENKWKFNYSRTFKNCLVWENKTIIVTDNSLNIMLATCNMYDLNGYQPSDVIGLNPKIFQGPATNLDDKRRIRKAIESAQPFESTIINYRKDGTLYDCHIEAYPIFNQAGQLVNFIALENKVYGRNTH